MYTAAPHHILHIITRLVAGGADENTILSCNHFAQLGHPVTIIYGHDFDAKMVARLHPSIKTIQVQALTRSISPLRDLRAMRTIRRLLWWLRPDIVHTHTSKAGVVGRLAAMGIPSLAVVHGIHILAFLNVGWLQRQIYIGLERLTASVTHAFVDVSPGMMETALAHGVGTRDLHYIVPSGMDIDAFRSHRTDAGPAQHDFATPLPDGDPAANILPTRRRVVYLANYEPRKSHRELIAAIGEHRDKFDDTTFTLAGTGALEADLRNQVDTLKLNSIVDVCGYVSDAPGLLRSADVCIYCSGREGLPRAVVQYCASGKPAVLFDLPGIDVIVKTQENGVICEQGDFVSMLATVRRILDDPSLHACMSTNARSVNLDNWSVANMGLSLESIYQTAVTRARSVVQ
jgi:glycosyltransferase involved in cell wall biosynthesis